MKDAIEAPTKNRALDTASKVADDHGSGPDSTSRRIRICEKWRYAFNTVHYNNGFFIEPRWDDHIDQRKRSEVPNFHFQRHNAPYRLDIDAWALS
jgi:hypothetical protein